MAFLAQHTMMASPNARRRRSLIYLYDLSGSLSGGDVERLTLSLIAELRRLDVRVILSLHVVAGDLLPLLPADLQVVPFATGSDGGRREAVGPRVAAGAAGHPAVQPKPQQHRRVGRQSRRISCARVIICQHNPLSREASEPGAWK